MAITDVQVKTITPEIAGQLLSTNHQNRGLNKDRVNKYAADMSSGKWKESGQGITIYREPDLPHNEYLQDGQTRLYGIIESQVAHRFVITYVDEPVFDVIDIGQTRSLAQMLGIHFRGRGNASWLSVTATALSICDVLIPDGEQAYRNDSKASRILRLEENFGAYENAAPIIREGYLHCGRITGPAGHIAALISLCDAMDSSVVLPFFLRVASGEELKGTMPEYALREALLSRALTNSTDNTAHSAYAAHLRWYEAAIRAWNNYAKEEPMTRVHLVGTIPPILTTDKNVIPINARVNTHPPILKPVKEHIGAATRLKMRREAIGK